MRKLLGVFVSLSVLLYSAVSFAYTVEVRENIPDKYMLVVVYGADPDKPIDEKDIREHAYAKAKTINYYIQGPYSGDLQIAVYDEGKHFGEGMRAAFGKASTSWDRVSEPGGEPISEEILGYFTLCDSFFSDFVEDSAAAEKLYKNTTFFLGITVKRIARDKHGTPYVEGDQFHIGFDYTVRIYLSKDDPLLSTLKRGEALDIRGRVTDFSNNVITLQGKITTVE